jgi:Flp pilus assembly protein TadB
MSKHTARREYIQHQWNQLENTATEQGRFEDYDEYEYIMLKRMKKWRRGMREWIYDAYQSVMGWNRNPLRHIKDVNTRHLVTQVLCWMWCIVFSIWVGSWTVFGYTAIAHLIVIAAIFITVGTFKVAEARPEFFTRGTKTLKYEEIAGKYEDIW